MRKAERRLLPGIERRMDMVAKPLLETLRGLATGKLRWPLYLHGLSGAGKTAASLALCDFTESACYSTADDLADFIMANSAGDVQAEWERIAGKHLSVLDEIGERQTIGDLAYRTVKKFADIREGRAGRVAIYVSNLNPSELQELFDDRVASRMLCGTVFELTDKDRRLAR